MTDRLLETRGERFRIFAVRVGGGVGPSLVLALVVAALGRDAAAVAIAFLGILLGLVVATSAKTNWGAVVGGVVTAVVLLLLQLVITWILTHPIQKS
jgi:uncharacterized BrkB/YihY/UPF0761 family membrane protein